MEWKFALGTLFGIVLVRYALMRITLKVEKRVHEDHLSFLIKRLGIALGYSRKGLTVEMLSISRDDKIKISLSGDTTLSEKIDLELIKANSPAATELLVLLSSYGTDGITYRYLHGEPRNWNEVLKILHS